MDSVTYNAWVNLASGTYATALIVGTSDYSNGTTGFYLIAPETSNNNSAATPIFRFITSADSSLSPAIVQVRSSYTIQGIIDATANQTLDTMRLSFKNTYNADVLSLTQDGGISIKNPIAAGTDTDLLRIGRLGSTMSVTQAGDMTLVGSITASSETVKYLTVSQAGSFSLGSSSFTLAVTTTAETYAVSVTTNQHVSFSGSSPTVSSCGAVPVGALISGNDQAGTIAVGGGVVTSCVLTFQNPYKGVPGNPVCFVGDNSASIASAVTAITNTSVTFGLSATLGGGRIYYRCVGVNE